MSDYIEAFVTVNSRKKALEIAGKILDLKLAACVQIGGPILSLYWWQGKKEKAAEWTLTIKTRMEFFAEIEKTVKRLHPYKVPEIIARDIGNGSGDYLEWIGDSMKDKT